MESDFPIEKYERIHTIGDGAFGPSSVHIYSSPFYKPSQVAIKQCSTNKEEDRSKLIHCNIVQCFGKCDLDGRRYSVTEACKYDLNQLMKNGVFERSDVSFLTGQILSGLSYLHGLGFVHGDLKPSNVLLNWRSKKRVPKIKEMVVKLTDFGFSKQGRDKFVTACGEQQRYMAPEIKRVYEEISKMGVNKVSAQCNWKADVFCLGMVVREMAERIVVPEGATNQLDQDVQFQDFLAACQKENPEERKKTEELAQMEFVLEDKEANETRQREHKAILMREIQSWKKNLRNSDDKGKVKAETVKEIPLRIFLDLQRLSKIGKKPFEPTILHVRSPKELTGKGLKEKFGIEEYDSTSGIYMFMLMPNRVEHEALSSLASLESPANRFSRSKPLFPIYFSSSRNFGAGLNKQPVVKQYFAVKDEGERDGLFQFFDPEMVSNYDLLLMIVAMPVEITSLVAVWIKEDFDFVLNGSRRDIFTWNGNPFHFLRWPKSELTNSLSLVKEWSELDKTKYEIYVQRLMVAFDYTVVSDSGEEETEEEEEEDDDNFCDNGGRRDVVVGVAAAAAKRRRFNAADFVKVEVGTMPNSSQRCNFNNFF